MGIERERRKGLYVLQKGREPPVKVDNEKAQELGKKERGEG